MHIDQRPAGVAGVDGRVGLDEIFKGVDAQMGATQGADDARGHGLTDTKRVADGQHHIAHLQVLGLAQHDDRQFVELDLEQGQVGVRVCADDLGCSASTVGQGDFDVVGVFDHMVVGEDVALGADDDAAAQPLLWRFIFAIAIEEAEPRVVLVILLGGFRLRGCNTCLLYTSDAADE